MASKRGGGGSGKRIVLSRYREWWDEGEAFTAGELTDAS